MNGTGSVRLAGVLAIATLWAATASAARLEDSTRTDDRHGEPHRYHAGVTVVGVQHLGGAGLGLFGLYGRLDRTRPFITPGGELLLFHSGERHVSREDAYNHFFSGDSLITGVYEQVSMIGLGGSGFVVVRTPPASIRQEMPGLALGLSAGVMFETDRVGLRSSELDYYYGYSSFSDTNVSLRPYLRPQVIVSQGPISLMGGMAVFPVFASWSIGAAYAW